MRVFKNLFGNGSKIHAREIAMQKNGEPLLLSTILGNAAMSISGKNINDIKSTGFYQGVGVLNSAHSTISTFIVIQYQPDWVLQVQFVMLWEQPTRIYIRHLYGSTWTDWGRVF